ncbi:hypothetical protein L916_03417, partial [Phytophthora nicotianae]
DWRSYDRLIHNWNFGNAVTSWLRIARTSPPSRARLTATLMRKRSRRHFRSLSSTFCT